ncbi:MAG: hypothetical protein KKD63_16220, partial [Proteobacteria bacterium]|nr:hypothetical protein [Pseudomonadota bacterium]
KRGLGEVEIHLHHRNDTREGLEAKLIEFRDRLHNEHGLLGRWKERADHDSLGQQTAQSTNDRIIQSSGPAFGFIHGNWALCNSQPDGDWCGVNEELAILKRTGCYADFTFPSAPSPTQPRMVNSIYYAQDNPGKPRGHDWGEVVKVQVPRHEGTETRRTEVASSKTGRIGAQAKLANDEGREIQIEKRVSQSESARPSYASTDAPNAAGEREACSAGVSLSESSSFGDPLRVFVPSWPSSLMMIQGPLALNWHRRKLGILPRLENGEISGVNPPIPSRVDLWARQQIHVVGRPEWVFVKVHTHGCVEENMDVLLNAVQDSTPNIQRPTCNAQHALHKYLQERYNHGTSWCLHYVTAREMYNIARAAEDGMSGNPGQYRDYEIERPQISR